MKEDGRKDIQNLLETDADVHVLTGQEILGCVGHLATTLYMTESHVHTEQCYHHA